ncbi:Uncharacterised protein [Pseudomonas aeruginosa]|nr:Uncharacterised protein [Pseudomonas aeruginosa]
MGLLDGQVLATLGLPVLDEGGVVGLVQLAGRVVGYVQQWRGGGRRAGYQDAGECGQGETTKGHVQLLMC